MSSAAAKQIADASAERLDSIYTTRDDIARSFNPVTQHERMLVTAVAQAWERLQRAYELERRTFEPADPTEQAYLVLVHWRTFGETKQRSAAERGLKFLGHRRHRPRPARLCGRGSAWPT
jgi:hypothetical protein